MKMTQIDFIRLRGAAQSARLLDVDGEIYCYLVDQLDSFDELDLCFLASKQIRFVSTIARTVMERRDRALSIVNLKEITQ